MDKIILFVLLIAISIGAGMLFFSHPSETSFTQEEVVMEEDAIEEPDESDTYLLQEQDGIEVEVLEVEQVGEITIVSLALNNHQYDLGQDTIYEEATLNGAASLSHVFDSSASGGHHVKVDVIFDQATSGDLVIAPTDQTIFTFSDLW